MQEEQHGDQTTAKTVHDRLLDAAEQMFAEKGFAGTNIRHLAAAAQCNLAAVNYYFGSKDKLYAEVWQRHLRKLTQARVSSIDKVMSERNGQPALEHLLLAFSNAFIEPLMQTSEPNLLLKLMVRESIDPHLAPQMFNDEVIQPTMSTMQNALIKVCPGLKPLHATLAIFSLVGQLMQAARIKVLFDKAHTPEIPALTTAQFVEHIVKFTAAGIIAYKEGTIA